MIMEEINKETNIMMTNEERRLLADELRKKTVNHKCKIIPFNQTEWTDGVVVGIIEDKNINKVFYKVILDDGRRAIKTSDSKLIKIYEEKVERGTIKYDIKEKSKVIESNRSRIRTTTEIEINEKQYVDNIGKSVEFLESFPLNIARGRTPRMLKGRILAVTFSRNDKRYIYKIELEDGKIYFRFANLEIHIEQERDERGEKILQAYINKHNGISNCELDEKGAFELAAKKLNKAKDHLFKAQKDVYKWQEVFDKAKREYEQSLANGKTFEDYQF